MTATPNAARARTLLDGLHTRDEADLWIYWTAGAGRVKWTTAPRPLLALYGELVKHMEPAKAHSAALSWFVDGLGRKPRHTDGTLPDVTG